MREMRILNGGDTKIFTQSFPGVLFPEQYPTLQFGNEFVAN